MNGDIFIGNNGSNYDFFSIYYQFKQEERFVEQIYFIFVFSHLCYFTKIWWAKNVFFFLNLLKNVTANVSTPCVK